MLGAWQNGRIQPQNGLNGMRIIKEGKFWFVRVPGTRQFKSFVSGAEALAYVRKYDGAPQ
jgi:hypothetical protein